MEKEISLEKHLKEIKEIIDRLQQGGLDFDKHIGLFKEGSKLIHEARQYLDKSELLVQKLVEQSGQISEESFDPDQEGR